MAMENEAQKIRETTADLVAKMSDEKRFNNLIMTDDQLVIIMRKAIDIAEWLGGLNPEMYNYGDAYKSGGNFFYGHVKDNGGLILVESYYGPDYIMTPLGQWPVMNGGTRSKDWQEKAKERLGMKVLEEHVFNGWGSYGPVYLITTDLEGNALPDLPWEVQDKSMVEGYKTIPNADYDTISEIWERIKPRLNLNNPFKDR
jgi:hypothetical protein